ncbi:gamma-glutamylcyclotransferase [Streptomyces sp. NPDC059446]|uniref:gamma-glutamylcyclotransferase n=1 Tax=Streptomyces sp. NPDC059446 TaxID=3346833 RepID=UPI0036918E33
MTDGRLPFLVHGTLLPGAADHDRFLRGRTRDERPAVPPGALLCEGPGHPYAVDGPDTVHGTLVTAAPGAHGELLRLLDDLERYRGPDHPRNLYDRLVRSAHPRCGRPTAPRRAGTAAPRTGRTRPGRPGPLPDGPVRAWFHLAAAPVVRSLRTGGTPVPGGDRLSRRPPPARRTP